MEDFEIDKERLINSIRSTNPFGCVKLVYQSNEEFNRLTELMADPDIILACTDQKVNITFELADGCIDHKFLHQCYIYAIYTAALELSSRSQFSAAKWIEMIMNHSISTLSEVENVEAFIEPIGNYWPDGFPDVDELKELRGGETPKAPERFIHPQLNKIGEIAIEKTDSIYEDLNNASDCILGLLPFEVLLLVPILQGALLGKDVSEMRSLEAVKLVSKMNEFVLSVSPNLRQLRKEITGL